MIWSKRYLWYLLIPSASLCHKLLAAERICKAASLSTAAANPSALLTSPGRTPGHALAQKKGPWIRLLPRLRWVSRKAHRSKVQNYKELWRKRDWQPRWQPIRNLSSALLCCLLPAAKINPDRGSIQYWPQFSLQKPRTFTKSWNTATRKTMENPRRRLCLTPLGLQQLQVQESNRLPLGATINWP